jgi:hypothetical protein
MSNISQVVQYNNKIDIAIFSADSRMDKPQIRSFSRHFITVPVGAG